MGLGGVAIAVPPYVIHPKTAVLGRAGGGNFIVNILFISLQSFSYQDDSGRQHSCHN